ncbi:thioredoxin family protein [Flexithrix dorotheae]|uniref:thioredoxin family protein n=1 Tax=Flexithrix dorotheae TaxID=70993 RepID=UPI00037B1892|nr:thioredoxin fold domain-containing protein [Flexithrix dorotheae]
MTKLIKRKSGYLFTSAYLVVAIIILGFSSNVKKGENDEKQINWLTIDEVQELSKKEPRKIFVDVYTSWCGYCKLMDRTTFTDPEVVDYVNKHYYAVKLNAESNKMIKFHGKSLAEGDLANAFDVSGYPTIVLLDAKMKTADAQPGYRKAKGFLKMLKQYNE